MHNYKHVNMLRQRQQRWTQSI